MNEMYFRVVTIQKKIDTNNHLRTIMKMIAALIVFVVFVVGMGQPGTAGIAWVISLPFIALLFGIEVYYLRCNRKYEFDIYELEVMNLHSLKETAELTGEPLPDNLSKCEIRKPEKAVSLPVLYYAIVLLLDILIGIFLIY